MRSEGRYSACVLHRGSEAIEFFADYLKGRQVLMVGGAGFDPRACTAAQELVNAGASLSLRLIREHRLGAAAGLVDAADSNLEVLRSLDPNLRVDGIDIFGSDGAVVGGRSAATIASRLPLDGFSDIVVDISALSIGTSFPIIRLLLEQLIATAPTTNLHITVVHDPLIDAGIRRIAGDRAGWIHGFSGNLGIDHERKPARLWMPQLAFGANQEIGRINAFVSPDDTCPILPFPSRDPRRADLLALEYRDELLNTWDVDVRNIVYADEDDPLDVYRTILLIDDLRHPVFEGSGGSSTIVSPTGSKLTALGALMACVERDLPVAYLEAESYAFAGSALKTDTPTGPESGLVHLWLEGEAYPQTRPALRKEV